MMMFNEFVLLKMLSLKA